MIVQGREYFKMPCENCAVQFSVFKRKRACSECERYYCSACLRRGGGTMCAPCRMLSTRPLSRQTIAHLKVKDLQCFLQRQNVSTRGCVEKEELLGLCVSHVNSSGYRRRGSRTGASPLTSTLKGITSNINDFLTSTFDLRYTNTYPAPPPPTRGGCFNSSHAHSPATESAQSNDSIPDRIFTATPGGENRIEVPIPDDPVVHSPASSEHNIIETADCYEIEDLDDTGWEFVNRPAEPLPNDSTVLLSTPGAAAGSPLRASSELELHRPESSATQRSDTASLQDEPLPHLDTPGTPQQVTSKQVELDQFKQASELETLNVKQLKELLTRNRVEYRGCVERKDLLERAKILWADHARYKDEIDNLPIEECCKICFAAPLECVLLECGHIAACTSCGKQLAECPICRQYVVRAVRCFRS
ncbi:E3 ubiquitin-protein ligase RNF34 [Leptidea sinapis]|uniref:E3 ubiquitin-protein ligase RNF34 n=1 Tax=Leptidea sinapis TaxID=189913 RepID=UPI0021C28267|nr:E3 ubiquitin-protein ligase RNF34 [Leptidea sinapis]